ncbi:MAG: VCBS repeat-containing protein [Myxococcales bacterium]|nr:VCBS repeat-containing protein [Myxococcales bacterium]
MTASPIALRAAPLALSVVLSIGCTQGPGPIADTGALEGGLLPDALAPFDASACAPEQTRCLGRCVDIASSPIHCGACANVCAAGANAVAVCALGRCAQVCAEGFADCDGMASNGCEVDTRSSVEHCGGCGRACAAPMGASAMCASGTCTACPMGTTACGSRCVDLQTDSANCGSCGNGCGTLACTSGVCAGPPTLVSAEPAAVFGARREMVTLTGTRFREGVRVRINGREAEEVQFVSPTRITLRAPALGLAGGPAEVEVVNNDGLGAVSRTILRVIAVTTTFDAPVSTATGTSVFHVAVRDFDGDGLADVVAPRPDAMTVTLLRANAMLRFDVAANVTVTGAPFFPAVGEFTGDSRPDIAVAARDRRAVFVLRNTGAGFTASTISVGVAPSGLVVGELTGDGAQDVLVGSSETSATMLAGGGDGSFTATDYALGAGMPFPSLGLVGSDARTAVLGAMAGSRGIVVARSLATTSREVTTYAIEGAALPIAIMADLDGRPPLDLLCSGSRGVAFFARGRTDGSFDAQMFLSPTLAGTAVGIAAQDVNGDGVVDVVVAGPGPRVAVYPNEGNATFSPTPIVVTAPGTPSGVALGDVNGDGKLDLVVPQGAGSAVLAYRNTSPTPMR